MSDGHQALRELSQSISQEIGAHINAPPQRRNQNRAEWGAGWLAAGIYAAWPFVWRNRTSPAELVQFYIRALHRPLDDSWPFYAWGAVMLFAMLWVAVGVRGSRGARDIMVAFWALFRIALAGVALWSGWYIDGYPVVNWFLKGFYIWVAGSSAMLLFVAMRGPGRGAVPLVQRHISQQTRTFRVGRRRTF